LALALGFLGGVGLVLVLALAVLGRGVLLVRGATFVGLFLSFYFVPCQMHQQVKNELNKKKTTR
jgi:hypothetical protein